MSQALNQSEELNVKIFRFDPEKDSSPYYDEYRIQRQGAMKIIDLLELIYRKYDPGLAFKSSCRSGKCGVCSVMVNGRAALACRADVPEGTVVIEPLANYPLIRDLIVDRTIYDQRVKEISSNASIPVQEKKGALRTVDPSDFDHYDRLTRCIECLMCDAECPVLPLSLQEYGGPALFRHDALLESDRRLLRRGISCSATLHLDYCSTCKACSASCPKEIDVFEHAIRHLRATDYFQEHGLSEIQKSYSQIIQAGGSLFSPFKVPLTEELPEVIEPEISAGRKVIFFPGCMMNMRLQGAGRAIVRVLESLGTTVYLPREMICCGGPLLWTGQNEQFEKVFSRNAGVLEKIGVSTVVAGCAGCGMTLKKEYEGRIKKQNIHSEFRCYDFTEYLTLLKPRYESRDKLRVTYHDPCHLRRGQGVWEEPRKVLNAMPDIHFVEMQNSDRCCGGMLAIANRKLAVALSEQKVEIIINANVDAVTTECPFCKDMISKALKKALQSIPVYTVAELIHTRYSAG
ncbi:MAG: succinate dehydrogenase/fumarate reductase iron-sulfur subunit [Deltaproteobacteria bacterium]|nr:succinate dehydrogenase/fumarate reductase iron-sulfur subunit [Deltaproteobacteria bacterium]